MRARVPVILVTAGAVALAAAPALADGEIVAAVSDRFTTPSVTIAQGEKVNFRNTDVVTHDVTSAQAGSGGAPLFQSAQIGLGRTAVVAGTEYLTSGSYPFICSIHPFMQGTLTVSSAGTPVPRPGSEAPPAEDGLTLSAGSVSAKTGGRLSVRVKVSAPATVTLRAAKAGSKTSLAKGRATFTAAGTKTVTLKATTAGRSALRRQRSVVVTVSISARPSTGAAVTTSKKAKLRR